MSTLLTGFVFDLVNGGGASARNGDWDETDFASGRNLVLVSDK